MCDPIYDLDDDADEDDPWYPEITEFLKKFPEAAFGPGHIVFADFNTEPGNIRECLHTAEMIKWYMENRQVQPISGTLDDSQQLYTLHFAIVDALAELDATITMLKHMLVDTP